MGIQSLAPDSNPPCLACISPARPPRDPLGRSAVSSPALLSSHALLHVRFWQRTDPTETVLGTGESTTIRSSLGPGTTAWAQRDTETDREVCWLTRGMSARAFINHSIVQMMLSAQLH
jgi:hypothetical protein